MNTDNKTNMKCRPAPARAADGSLPLLLRDCEVAQLLSVGRTAVWQMAKSGQIEIVRIGGSTRFTSASVLKLAGAAQAA